MSAEIADNDGWETVEPKKKSRKVASTKASDDKSDDPPFMIMLCGIPGSGKSYFAQRLAKTMPGKFIRINQDQLKTRRACENLCRRTISERKCPVIDRCNFSPEQRKHFLDIAREQAPHIPVDCIVLSYVSVEECIQRCIDRGDSHETITPSNAYPVVRRMANQFHPPDAKDSNEEGFRTVQHVASTAEVETVIQKYLC